MANITNRPQTDGNANDSNRLNALQRSLERLEAAFRTALTEPQREVYFEALMSIPADVMIPATDECIRTWRQGFGVNFPPIAVLIEFADGIRMKAESLTASRQIADRGDKPAEWEPATAEELQQIRDSVTQAARVKSMPALPKGMPSLREITEAAAAERNGKSTMPADPAERKEWAHRMAVKNGWMEERQPGQEG